MPAVLLLTYATGCSLLPGPKAAAACRFPDGTQLAFAGESSLAAVNLASGTIDQGGQIIDDQTVGTIYVTRDAWPIQAHGVVPDQRRYCAIYGDVTAIGFVPNDWSPPRLR